MHLKEKEGLHKFMGAPKGHPYYGGGGGRKKGVPNKITTTCKKAIEQVADRLGGVDRIVEWVREDPENEKVFWSSMYTKLLPLQVVGDKDNPLEVLSRIEIVLIKAEEKSNVIDATFSNVENESPRSICTSGEPEPV